VVPLSRSTQLPDKLFFKIGEVADLVGVKPHVLRYWESEFPALRPLKTRGAHRIYRRGDVELAMLIRRLVHDEGYTVPGARKQLRVLGHAKVDSEPDPQASREVALRAELLGLRSRLAGMLEELETIARSAEAPPKAVRIQQVVPAASVSVPTPVRRSRG